MAVETIQVEELLEQTDWLRRMARGLVQSDEAEDVAQETLLSALTSPPPSDRPLRPWLARVATNVVRMNYRRDSRRRRREQAFSDEIDHASRDDVLHRFELHQAITELMVELPEPFRSTLLHRYFEDQTSAEIAASEGIAAGTVRWRIKRGLEMIRQRLDEQSGDRKTWMLALQPFVGQPSTAVTASGVAATAITKGAMAMTVGKVAAAVVAVAALSVGGYAIFDSQSAAETESVVAQPPMEGARTEQSSAELAIQGGRPSAKEKLGPSYATPHRDRPKLRNPGFVQLVHRTGESQEIWTAIRRVFLARLGEERGRTALQIYEDLCGEAYHAASAGLETKSDGEDLAYIIAAAVANRYEDMPAEVTDLLTPYLFTCLYDIDSLREPLRASVAEDLKRLQAEAQDTEP